MSKTCQSDDRLLAMFDYILLIVSFFRLKITKIPFLDAECKFYYIRSLNF